MCSVERCGRKRHAHGLCAMHAARLRRTGSTGEAGPRYVGSDATLAERLSFGGWNITVTGCWEWAASRRPTGYGVLSIGQQRLEYAHRISWTVHRGPIPDGQFVCHSCDNPPCINPDHLFLGSVADNNTDMAEKQRHAYGEINGRARLSNADVEQIRAELAAGALPAEIAARWHITRGYVYGIKARARRRIA